MLSTFVPFVLIALALADDYPYTNFSYPTGPIRRDNASNITVNYGDTVDVAWTSTWIQDPQPRSLDRGALRPREST